VTDEFARNGFRGADGASLRFLVRVGAGVPGLYCRTDKGSLLAVRKDDGRNELRP
jgi:hypothetical protein